MGFMDKLKDAGKSALKGALVAAATPYGTVTKGKHKLCKVCMNSTYDKLIFVKVATIEAEYVIKDDIITFIPAYEDDSNFHHTIDILFKDGESCHVILNVDKNQGSALESAGARLAAHYKEAALLVEALAKHVPQLSDDTRNWANKIMRYAGKKEI